MLDMDIFRIYKDISYIRICCSQSILKPKLYVKNPEQFDTITDTIELGLLNLKLENLAFFSSRNT